MPRDLRSDLTIPVELLFDSNKTATAWSNYVDLQGYEGCTILVRQSINTGSSGNTFTPALWEADSSPGSTGSYTVVASDELVGSYTVFEATTDKAPELVGYMGNARYVTVKLTETGTADADFTIYAILSAGRHRPSSANTPTTGTVT